MDQSGIAEPGEPIIEDGWPWEPLVGFLVRLELAVAEARRSGASGCLLTEDPDLVFRLRSESVLEVASQRGAIVAAAPIDEFDAAITRFRQAARAWLEAEAPHLLSHPAWADWFPPTPA